MKLKITAALFSSMLFSVSLYSQNSESLLKRDKLQELRSEILTQTVVKDPVNFGDVQAKSKKSPGLALLFSLVLPGAGHYYIDRMDVGKYFLGIDAASWIGLVSLNIYGNNVRDDARVYSKEHADLNPDGKDDDYYASVGGFDNVYEYNNEKLAFGEYTKLYDVNKFYWNWDNQENRFTFESQRKSSERIYNSRIIFGSLLIANRIISGISSFLLANKTGTSASFNLNPELLYQKDYSFDGVRINLSKNF